MAERMISISAGDVTVTAVLNDSQTSDLLWEALPLEASANTWGDDIYFRITVQAEEDYDAGDVVPMGAVAYWPPGQALCLFFGRTPASRGDEIRAASAVNMLGAIEGDAAVLKQVRSGTKIVVGRAGN
ncbi:MAG: cyclophilin-like fold protein [Chloroflexi bacterium]|nr:cyclophilin-like fold protein [Chloroflexota bacterium]